MLWCIYRPKELRRDAAARMYDGTERRRGGGGVERRGEVGRWRARSLCTERRLLRTAEHRMGGMGSQKGEASVYLDEEGLHQEEGESSAARGGG